MSTLNLQKNLFWLGSLDPHLRVFDIVMKTQFGTTYNVYLLKTNQGNVLFETVKERFFDDFIEKLKSLTSLDDIHYLVVNHTEPDHSGSIEKLIGMCPNIKILASSVAIDFLAEICNRPLPTQPVGDNEVIEIGEYHLQFLSLPFLHWPDSMFTYIQEMKTLVTCDSFGAHYSDEKVVNDQIDFDFIPSAKYYFDMIMGPFKSYVRTALERIKPLDVNMICPGHGPVWRENIDKIIQLYYQWSDEPPVNIGKKPKVTIAYVSAYGYTQQLANTIADGVKKVIDCDVNLYDMVTADSKDVFSQLTDSQGIIFGSPTINSDVLPPVMDLVSQLNGILNGGKVAGAFGSYGWSGEGPELLMERLKLMRMDTVEPAFKIRFKPSEQNLHDASEYGERFGKKLESLWIRLTKKTSKRILWKCVVCGEIFESPMPPKYCPACGATAEAMVPYQEEINTFKTEQHFNIVIVGGGVGAASAIESIKKTAPNANITMISKEKSLPYYRPSITKKFATLQTAEENLLHPQSWYDEHGVKVILNTEVIEIDKDMNEVHLSSGALLTYDKLLLATGSNSFRLPVSGVQLPGVFVLRTYQDANTIQAYLGKESRKVAIVGGGLLGLETAWQLIQMGHEVTILETFPILLPRQLDSESATILKCAIKSHAKAILLGVNIESFNGINKVDSIKLQDGRILDVDCIIMSVGVRSETSLAAQVGLKIDHAIVVDSTMKTSQDDIYAVGDCAICNGKFTGLWETATEQGKIAGRAMCGDVSASWSNVLSAATFHAFNHALVSIGMVNIPEDEEVVQIINRDDLNCHYSKLAFKNDRLIGGILMGDLNKTHTLISAVNKQYTSEESKDVKLI